MKAHLYLRASTKDQDANRARQMLEAFASDHSLTIADVYAENISGTKLERPELSRLLDAAQAGDVLVVESVDRLSRLTSSEWDSLKSTIEGKGLRLVVIDLPTSHQLVDGNGITGAIMKVINNMLLDLMATMARLDQEKRVERIKQGIENKKAANPEWKPAGKGKNAAMWEKVTNIMAKHPTMTADDVAKLAECGVATVYRIKKELKAGG
ncbi:recombinase family protein [Pseudomonas sp. P66]|uniref:Recombinase family protein n=2 Tax=Pseudomonas TaxID=286 RepID=A0AB35WYU1_9PSED|nr:MULTISPECIES: recombinase family protein [Pseudomonas]MBM5459599.1 recombinase family protein [Pseudomonas arcuscaelestis]MEE1869831.1 recombinase family protein [Pseudomonas sp. 120P]MEE1960831.1 recombinase family protein [Pseudomonas sp. 119P]